VGTLFVETSVRLPREAAARDAVVDRLWALTQDPVMHPRWDLRFSSITPTGHDDAGAQLFTYALALPHPRWPVRTVRGTGASTAGRRDASGRGASALRWTSADPLSPLGPGAGWWRYAPEGDAVRFVTGYDYAPGWGRLGRVLDPWLVRPLVGWATAWSFDRLRLWVEAGADPARSRDLAVARAGARLLAALAGAVLAARGPAGAVPGAVLLALARWAPLPDAVPSARRCRRRPADRRPPRPPSSLADLHEPAPLGASGEPLPVSPSW